MKHEKTIIRCFLIFGIALTILAWWFTEAYAQTAKPITALASMKANATLTIEAKTVRNALELPTVDCIIKSDSGPLSAFGAFMVHVQSKKELMRTEWALKDTTTAPDALGIVTLVDTTMVEIEVGTGIYPTSGIWARKIEVVKDKLILTRYDDLQREEYDLADCRVFSARRWEGQR